MVTAGLGSDVGKVDGMERGREAPGNSQVPRSAPRIKVKLCDLKLNAHYRTREELDDQTVEDYALAMSRGDMFPPLDVYCNGIDDFITDGWHRYEAAKMTKATEIEVIRSTFAEHELRRSQAKQNCDHGRRRTNEDKRRVVRWLLLIDDIVRMTDSSIAGMAKVDHKTVSKIRSEMLEAGEIEDHQIRESIDGRNFARPSEMTIRSDTGNSDARLGNRSHDDVQGTGDLAEGEAVSGTSADESPNIAAATDLVRGYILRISDLEARADKLWQQFEQKPPSSGSAALCGESIRTLDRVLSCVTNVKAQLEALVQEVEVVQ